jgi:hypothetical protein
MDLILKGANSSFGAISAREYVRLEKAYAADRSLQTRYLGMRLWGFVTGTNPKWKPVDLIKAKEHTINVARCVENTKKDKEALASATDVIEKNGKRELITRTPETVCEAYVSMSE